MQWLSDRLLPACCGFDPHKNKYLYGLQVVVPGLADCVCDFSVCERTHDTEIIPRVGHGAKKCAYLERGNTDVILPVIHKAFDIFFISDPI